MRLIRHLKHVWVQVLYGLLVDSAGSMVERSVMERRRSWPGEG